MRHTVKRRRIFYIPGYDPIPPRRYRELYRKESAAQGRVSGYSVRISPRQGGYFGWRIKGIIDGAGVAAECEVLFWSDIVKASMEAGIIGTYALLLRTAWMYIASGALFRLMRLRKGPVITALYPVGFLLAQLLLAVLVGAAGCFLFRKLWSEIIGGAGGLSLGIGLAIWGGLIWHVLRWFRARDNRFFAYYLMHDYAYSARWRGAYPPELEARMAEFTAAIAAALQEDAEEVLVVGHSSGAHLGVSILADLIRSGQVPEGGPALAFLTLGQVVPMVSFLPEAKRLRGDLAYLSAREELTWVDVSAPGDGACFALCDPVRVSGVAPEGKGWPLVISASFTRTLKPETWKALRWRFFRLHFQYLCAFDRPGDYDYFRITAGPVTLAERYAGRAPSPSRIERVASSYRSLQ